MFSFGTECVLTNVRFAQNAGFLPKTAQTDSEIVLQNRSFRLLRYKSKNRKYKTPVLIVSSLVGKYYILDLTAERSYVSHLLNEGFDVFIIDWTTDDASEKFGLDVYADKFLSEIVERVCELSKSKKVSLLGYSLGGILALIYSALYVNKVKNLILLTTPIDFSQKGAIRDWTSEEAFDVDRTIDWFGNISGEAVSFSMQMVKPVSSFLRGANILQFAENRKDFDALTALEIWLQDAAPFPAELFRDVIKKLYRKNLLTKNELKIGEKKVDLKKIKASVLNVVGTHDQVVTPESSEKLFGLLGKIDKTQIELDYGHLTISVGSGAKEDFWKKSAEWLKEKS
jgi:polyhydroxyalkanoate synthase